ncbi:hypothetical protein [Sphingomonas rubra]|uniref:Major facilitator superfamily (MFS) profile domain-containing protein n=1 Tax=Sphingomonas rubra TaxID=634430 RepID=A0A1I5QLG5_9SPHN|nr:hypothetical protein [Sphingomonas rubra]SFP46947.1 hypothetical protein SAMN04488241_102130 [Sphingomonas rubra]
MTVPTSVARRRWLALVGTRLAGVAGAMLGLVLAARATTIGPKLLGIAIVLAALVIIAVVPASLAHRWRSPE